MSETEQRTTRDGLAVVDGPAVRTDSLGPLVEAVRRLEASMGRAAKAAEASRARAERRRHTERDKALTAMVDEAFQKIGRPTPACRFYEEYDEGF